LKNSAKREGEQERERGEKNKNKAKNNNNNNNINNTNYITNNINSAERENVNNWRREIKINGVMVRSLMSQLLLLSQERN